MMIFQQKSILQMLSKWLSRAVPNNWIVFFYTQIEIICPHKLQQLSLVRRLSV